MQSRDARPRVAREEIQRKDDENIRLKEELRCKEQLKVGISMGMHHSGGSTSMIPGVYNQQHTIAAFTFG